MDQDVVTAFNVLEFKHAPNGVVQIRERFSAFFVPTAPEPKLDLIIALLNARDAALVIPPRVFQREALENIVNVERTNGGFVRLDCAGHPDSEHSPRPGTGQR